MSVSDAAPERYVDARRQRVWRHIKGRVFRAVGILSVLLGIAFLTLLLVDVALDGLPWLRPQLFSEFPSRFPERAGLRSALQGTLGLLLITGLLSFPVGVGAAIYLEEYANNHWYSRLIEINISNLAGVPSIIYGLLGLGLFVRALSLGRSLLAGSLTMSLLVLPIVIVAAREAIRAVPASQRQAAFALGATRWQVIRDHVLPSAMSGILTGLILALARAIGETAPLITIGALTFIAFDLRGPMDIFTVLPIQIFNWISLPQKEFHDLAAAGIVILLVVLLIMNSLALYLRYRFRRQW
jgi:phosphate transport system permease protein